MRYWRYLPAQYGAPGSRTFPVIISLHGRGETGDLQLAGRVAIARRIQVFNEEMCFVVNGARDCFIVLSPWIERAYEIAYVTAIMAVVDQMPQVDRSRIYLTGLSMGGGMALKFAALPGNASRFAALTPLAAAAGTVVAGDTPCTIADADLPVWALHDVGDAVVSFAQSEAWVNTINGERALPDGSLCGAPTPRARLTALSGFGHQIWDTIYDPSQRYFLDGSTPVNLYHWLLLHRH
jgi:predicted peptidase